jgi:acetyl-CoA carboxylase carboxyl transferase subunit beta
VLPVDTLKFKGTKSYAERLKSAMEATGETDALVVISGAIMSVPVVVACFEFNFMGGSMGSVVGERFVRGAQAAIDQHVPFICITASGGAHAGGLDVADADGEDHRHAGQTGGKSCRSSRC